jgi:hypothetical protein
MGVKKKIKIVMIDKNIKTAQMAAGLGINYQSFVNKVNRDTMSYKDAEEIANLLNCDIVFRDRATGKIY